MVPAPGRPGVLKLKRGDGQQEPRHRLGLEA